MDMVQQCLYYLVLLKSQITKFSSIRLSSARIRISAVRSWWSASLRLIMFQHSKGMIANHLQKRPLLIAINVVAGVSIFFFGKLSVYIPP